MWTMSLPISEKFSDLFSRPILCAFTTLNPDGAPHTVPVWCDYDGAQVRVNLRASTKKARNVQRNSAVCLLVIDPDNPGHWIEIQGRVGELRDEEHGAREHINALSQKYTGNPVYPFTAQGNERQMYLIDALKINGR
jgi:PPOX class probable F420-dependent enzyme